jgi:hypothetical protein
MIKLVRTAKETAPAVVIRGGRLDIPRVATLFMRAEKIDFLGPLHGNNIFGSCGTAVGCSGARENKVSGRTRRDTNKMKERDENTH